jgi:2-aminobenzoate-CoA ligase
MFPLRFGAAAATIEQASPPALLEAIARFGVTHLGTAPTAYKAMLATGPQTVRPELVEGLSSLSAIKQKGSPSTGSGRTEGSALSEALKTLRYCISAGEHLPDATWSAWKERTGISITDGIGSTEMMHIFVSAAGDEIRPGSTGKAVPGYAATVLDSDGNPMDEGVGRLAIRGPTGCRYLDDPRQRDYVQHGWNVTGDTYRRDANGYYWYLARSDDMIVSSGYNIGAPEVENALLSHPAVAECAVIGVPCRERGQKVKAFVVLASDARPSEDLTAELQAHAKRVIAPYKYPREIQFVEALPKTVTGKLRRSELRTGRQAETQES